MIWKRGHALDKLVNVQQFLAFADSPVVTLWRCDENLGRLNLQDSERLSIKLD